MPWSVLDLYSKVLPRTNCRECGFPTCMAFASMVVSEGLPLEKCPHVAPEKLKSIKEDLKNQQEAGRWTRRDPAKDALKWAMTRAASMKIDDLPMRIGGRLVEEYGEDALEIPYFLDTLLILPGRIIKKGGGSLNRWEQVFIYNHMAQGGMREPTGKWKGLVELPNTVSKIKTMEGNVEKPIAERFRGHGGDLVKAALAMGGSPLEKDDSGADAAIVFRPLPRIPVMLMFWDEEGGEGFGAQAKLLFDETILEHLDIESILFMSERIKQLLCGEGT